MGVVPPRAFAQLADGNAFSAEGVMSYWDNTTRRMRPSGVLREKLGVASNNKRGVGLNVDPSATIIASSNRPGSYRGIPTLTIKGEDWFDSPAFRVQQGAYQKSAIDIETDGPNGQGYCLRIIYPQDFGGGYRPGTQFGPNGHIETVAWVVISGTPHQAPPYTDTLAYRPTSNDPFMLCVFADVLTAQQNRGFTALDSATPEGIVAFEVLCGDSLYPGGDGDPHSLTYFRRNFRILAEDGSLWWGNTRLPGGAHLGGGGSYDTYLRRESAGRLRSSAFHIEGDLQVDGEVSNLWFYRDPVTPNDYGIQLGAGQLQFVGGYGTAGIALGDKLVDDSFRINLVADQYGVAVRPAAVRDITATFKANPSNNLASTAVFKAIASQTIGTVRVDNPSDQWVWKIIEDGRVEQQMRVSSMYAEILRNMTSGYFYRYADNATGEWEMGASVGPLHIGTAFGYDFNIDVNHNVMLWGMHDRAGNGRKVFGIDECTVVPTTIPAAGVLLYVEGGSLKALTSAGNVRTLAAV